MQYEYKIDNILININTTNTQEINKLLQHLLGLSLNDIDFIAAKTLCEAYFHSTTRDIKYISIVCAGHIARVYKKLIDQSMIEDIKKISTDSKHEFYGTANDALEDIEMFVEPNIRK